MKPQEMWIGLAVVTITAVLVATGLYAVVQSVYGLIF